MPSPRSYRPILAALAGVAALALMDAFMKGASLAIGAYSAALLRSALGLCLIAPVWLAAGGRWPGRQALRLHLVAHENEDVRLIRHVLGQFSHCRMPRMLPTQ